LSESVFIVLVLVVILVLERVTLGGPTVINPMRVREDEICRWFEMPGERYVFEDEDEDDMGYPR
jgi:hypothetical protein